MSARRVAIGERPKGNPDAEVWIRCGDSPGATISVSLAELYTARLTIDVTPQLRARIKVAAFGRGMTVADMLRKLFEREYPAPNIP